SEVGVSYRELIAEVTSEAGVPLRETDAPPGDSADEASSEPDTADQPVEPDEADSADEPDVADGQAVSNAPVEPDPEPATGADKTVNVPDTDAPTPGPDQDSGDGFDFSFQAPPMVRGGL